MSSYQYFTVKQLDSMLNGSTKNKLCGLTQRAFVSPGPGAYDPVVDQSSVRVLSPQYWREKEKSEKRCR